MAQGVVAGPLCNHSHYLATYFPIAYIITWEAGKSMDFQSVPSLIQEQQGELLLPSFISITLMKNAGLAAAAASAASTFTKSGTTLGSLLSLQPQQQLYASF